MKKHPMQIYEWLDYWRVMYFRANVCEKTYENSYFNLQIIKSHFQNCTLTKITFHMIQDFLNNLRDEGYSKESIKKYISYIRRALDKAVENGLLSINPSIGYIIPKAPQKKVRALTQEQQKVLEIFCNGVLYGEFMKFLLMTGLRVGEFTNLRHRHYNKKERMLYIATSKTESGVRNVPLIAKAQKIIDSQPISGKDDYIFHNKHGNPITYNNMKKCYEQLREKTGFSDFTNHVCRHSFATRLMEKGVNPKSAAALLGHKKVDFCLNVYTDIEKATMIKDIFVLEELPKQEDTKYTMTTDCLDMLNQLAKTNGGQLPENIVKMVVNTALHCGTII